MGNSGSPNRKSTSRADGGFRRLRIDDLINHDASPENRVSTAGVATGRAGRGGGGRGTAPGRGGAGASGSAPDRKYLIKCQYCTRQFMTRDELKHHRRTAHPTTFVCEKCDTSFFDRGNLNKHIRSVHEKRRPFQCEHCSSTFAFSDGLKRHVRMVHLNDRPFPCPFCSQAFKQRAHLLKHISARHPEQKGASASSGTRK